MPTEKFDSLVELQEFSKRIDTGIYRLKTESKFVREKLKLLQIKEEFSTRNAIFIEEISSFNKENKLTSNHNQIDLSDLELALLGMTEESKTQTVRFIVTLLIVSICSTLSFLLVKNSVDWAGNSKIELNRMRDEELTRITEEINQKYNINKGNLD